MEKSIENIWKEGFLKSDALVAPKINDLYNRKSSHIIDKFKRMFRINLIAIVAFTVVFLAVTYFLDIFLTGIIFFVTLNMYALFNKRLLNDLEKIDKGESSYQYLKAFNQWIQRQVAINSRLSTVLYPIIFLALIIGQYFKDAEGVLLGKRLINEVLIGFPNIYMVYGIPLIAIIGIVIIIGLLAFFGGRIYKWDLNIVYGRVFKKLEELMADIEELKNP